MPVPSREMFQLSIAPPPDTEFLVARNAEGGIAVAPDGPISRSSRSPAGVRCCSSGDSIRRSSRARRHGGRLLSVLVSGLEVDRVPHAGPSHERSGYRRRTPGRRQDRSSSDRWIVGRRQRVARLRFRRGHPASAGEWRHARPAVARRLAVLSAGRQTLSLSARERHVDRVDRHERTTSPADRSAGPEARCIPPAIFSSRAIGR